ncbi:MAG TPA: Flp pilus assembly protein CpaB [Actinomycetota bacterium]|nr:Flp pilus assembly protein CpaB [Actinomycetota bacterium]
MRRGSARPSWIFLSGSVTLALLAGVMVHSFLRRLEARAGDSGVRVPVLVVAQDVRRGTPIAPGHVSVVHMPEEYVPPRPLSKVSQAAGRVALGDLLKGEVVTDHRLARVRAGPVASLVPEGLRAFAVPTSLPAGTVRAGDHVDVLATFASGQPHTEVVVSGVEVLFVLRGGDFRATSEEQGGFDAGAAGSSPSTTLILLVAPQQEERLAFARAFANLEVAIAPAYEGSVSGL